MKFISLLLLATVFLLSACNNDKKTDKSTTAASATDTKEEVSEVQKKLDALQLLTPYTDDEMRAMVPVQIGNDSATDISVHNSMGTGYASASYKLSDSTAVELSIFDCGGNAGSGIYNAQYAGLLNSESGDDEEYTKIISFKAGKAIEHADKRRNNSSLAFIAKDRLLVTLEGKNVGADELRKMGGKISFK
ncbi:MAG: hypothetical protein ABI480_04850 [Chitinophagaceae bacterium]